MVEYIIGKINLGGVLWQGKEIWIRLQKDLALCAGPREQWEKCYPVVPETNMDLSGATFAVIV
jgi:hypothetical protein